MSTPDQATNTGSFGPLEGDLYRLDDGRKATRLQDVPAGEVYAYRERYTYRLVPRTGGPKCATCGELAALGDHDSCLRGDSDPFDARANATLLVGGDQRVPPERYGTSMVPYGK